ncbi:hypothetical protein D3C78_1424730 [compost metagenome]
MEIAAPVLHRFGHGFAPPFTQVKSLCILADGEDQLHLRHCHHHPLAPVRRTFAPGRQVAALVVITGKTEAHGHDGETIRVIECLPIDIKPLAQPVTRGIVEGQPRFVHTKPRRLPGNKDARLGRHDDHRPGFVRQTIGHSIERHIATETTAGDFAAQPVQPIITHWR